MNQLSAAQFPHDYAGGSLLFAFCSKLDTLSSITAQTSNVEITLTDYGSFISVTEAVRKETIRLLTPIEVLYSIESAIRLMIAGP